MRSHRGMRPQDIVILLKIAAKEDRGWYMKDLAWELGISQSEVSESLQRSVTAGLIAPDKKRLMKAAILEFLQYGLRYVYPQRPGAMVRGMPTAHSAPPLRELIDGEDTYVWPYSEGSTRGFSIEPLYPAAPEACRKDEKLYELLALCDALRVGKVRERELAMAEIKKRL